MRRRSVSKVIFLVGSFVAFSSFGYSQSTTEDRIGSLNRELVEAVRDGKFDVALSTSNKLILEVRSKYGEQSIQASVVLANRGSILRRLEKYSEAIVSIEHALKLRESLAPESLPDRISLLESLAYCKAKLKNYSGAAGNYDSALELVENNGIKPGKEHFTLFLNSANNAARLKELDKAHRLYLIANELAFAHFDVDSPEREDLLMSRTCLFRTLPKSEGLNVEFQNKAKRLSKEEELTGSVVHGKALSLPKPNIAPAARATGIRGNVFVRVMIDSQGKVTDAAAICSNAILAQGAVAAAKGAVFSPTFKNGRPIPITGLVTYNFQF